MQTVDKALFGGFIVTGNDPKRVMLRAIGPSMKVNGTPVPGRLTDPRLDMYDANGQLITSNDDWKDSPDRAEIQSSGLAPEDDAESAILRVINPGAYTAIVRGKNNKTGIALVEIYDGNTSADSTLANISSRAFVETADNVLIGGFIVGNQGAGTRTLLRAIGPSLKPGLPEAMDDPHLDLYNQNGTLLISNDNWKDAPNRSEIEATGIPPNNDAESAILLHLSTAPYTAIVRGKNDASGVALVEVYNVP